MRATSKLLLALSLAAPCFTACDARPGDAAASIPTQSPTVDAGLGGSLLDKMIAAESQVRFAGARRVEAHWKLGDERYDLEYREQVWADGAGRFAVLPLDLLEPELPTGQEDLFLRMSEARAAFSYRYRDFRIHDRATFQRNYEVLDSGAIAPVLGQDCAKLVVRRRKGAQIEYHLSVDLDTGLVLRCEERTVEGVLLGVNEFESLDFAPDLSQVAWHASPTDETDLADPRFPVGIGPGAHEPRLIAPSFTRLSAKEVTVYEAGLPVKFAEWTYTDGVEVLFLVYCGPVTLPAAGSARADDLVQLLPPIGPWQTAVATIRGERFIGMGRLSHGDLLDFIASSLY